MILFNNLERRVRLAKTDTQEADRLIREYQPFVMKTVKDHIGHYVAQENSDEFSVGITAFHEAIQAYQPDKGKFLSFSSRIIRLRLIDLYRSQHRNKPEISLEASQENSGHELTEAKALHDFDIQNENQQRRYEILALTEELSHWDISFTQLADHSPKQANLRSLYQEVAQTIARNDALRSRLMETKRLPMKELEDLCNIDRKRLDRGRIYIITCVIVLCGDYQFIQDYLEWK